MKFSCDSCHARYTIADEKVRGKILRVRCKKCGSSILLKEPEEAENSIPPALEAPVVREDDATHVMRAEEIKRGLGTHEGTEVAKFVSRQARATEVAPPPRPKPQPEWYILVQKEEIGPLHLAELKERASSGKITPRTYVWRDGLPNWARLQTVSELVDVLPLIPPSALRPTSPPPPPPLESTLKPGQKAETAPEPAATPTPVAAVQPEPTPTPGDEQRPDTEATPREFPRSTEPERITDPGLVAAPAPIDPSTLRTEIGTPSQEQTVPVSDLGPAAIPEATPAPAPLEHTPASWAEAEATPGLPAEAEEITPQPEPSANVAAPAEDATPAEAPQTAKAPPPVDDPSEWAMAPPGPPSLAPPPVEEEAPPQLFGASRVPPEKLIEARPPLPLTFDAPTPAETPRVDPLPSVVVNLPSDERDTVVGRLTPSAGQKEPAPPPTPPPTPPRPVSAPPRRPPPEQSASFTQALRPRNNWRQVAMIGVPVVAVLGVVALRFLVPPPAPPAPHPEPTPPVVAAPPAQPAKPTKKEAPKSAKADPAPATTAKPKPMTDEQAAFAAVQGDNAGHSLGLKPADLIHASEEDLNRAPSSDDVDGELLARKVKQIQPAIEQCVSSELRHNENFHVGKLKVNVVIESNGEVNEVTFDRKVVTDGTLGDCLRPAFRNIRMPAHEGEPQHVEIPLSLP